MKRLQVSKDFSKHCRERLLELFSKLGLDSPLFRPLEGDLKYLAARFQHDGRTYMIEIYDEDVVMHEGKRIYECYLPEEFQGEDSLINGFTTRLRRLLSGGTWEGPDEKGLLHRMAAAFKRRVGR